MAYAIDTMQTAYSGGNPSAGPQASETGGFGGQGGPGAGQMAALGGGAMPAGGPSANASFGGGMGGRGGTAISSDVLSYLEANQGSATWLLAVSDSTTAGQIELSSGRAVMSTGGFSGSDNALALDQLKAYVASGELRFIEIGGGMAGGRGSGNGTSSDASSWVQSSCTAVSVNGTATSIYDCASAATSASGG